MAKNNRSVPPLRNRLKAALALEGKTVAAWARSKGHHESLVWMNLSGERLTPEIRTDLAAVLKLSVKKLDAEIAAIAAQRTKVGAPNDGEAA